MSASLRHVLVFRDDLAISRIANTEGDQETFVPLFCDATPVILSPVVGIIAPPKVLSASAHLARATERTHYRLPGFTLSNRLKGAFLARHRRRVAEPRSHHSCDKQGWRNEEQQHASMKERLHVL